MTLTPSRPVSAIPILVAMRALPDLITFICGLKFPSAILSPGITYLLFISGMAQKLTTGAKNPSESISSFFIIFFSLLLLVRYSALIFLSVGRLSRFPLLEQTPLLLHQACQGIGP